MERQIGEVFTYEGKTYQVVKGLSCKDCAFSNTLCHSFQTLVAGSCTPGSRKDKLNVIFKEIKGMEIKNNQLTIDIPEGMEIDVEHSNLSKGIIKFKKYNITLENIYENHGKDTFITNIVSNNTHTYNKISAIATLIDIANYYNKGWKADWNNGIEFKYHIVFDYFDDMYKTRSKSQTCNNAIYFAHREDAQAVINNPNFKYILDTIYKD